MEQEQKKGKHIGQRVLALLMALALIMSMYLAMRVQIRFSGLNYVGQVAEYAAQVTADNTGYLSRGTLDRAWTILRATVRRPRSYEEYDMYASIAIAREDYAGATEYLEGCIDTYPGGDAGEQAVLYLRLASLYVLQEDYENAMVHLDRAIELDPELAAARFLRAQMYATAGETEKAVAELDAYRHLDDGDAVILSSLGQLYESTGDYESAVECYTAGLSDQRAYQVSYYADRARCRLLMGDMEAARQDLETYFTREGSDPEGEAAGMLALCRMNDGEYQGAVEMFHRSVEDGHTAPYLLYSQSMLCAYMSGDYAVSARDGEKAIQGTEAAGEDSGELHFWTGLAYMVQEEYERATGHFTAAAKAGTFEDISYYLGVCALGQGKAEQAIGYFTDSVEKGESVTASLYNRGICYLQQDYLEDAAADLEAVVERNDDPELTAQAKELLEALAEVS